MAHMTSNQLGAAVTSLFLRAGSKFRHFGIMPQMAGYVMATSPDRHSTNGKVISEGTIFAVTSLCTAIHLRNVTAGWWTDPETGQFLTKRNIGEMLMLMVTELEEARHGFITGMSDDKLPRRSMLEVEIADALIRLFDFAGYYAPNLAEAFDEECWAVPDPETTLLDPMAGTIFLARAMEASRKSKQMEGHLAKFLVWAMRLSLQRGLNVGQALEEKLEYNLTRADHKMENRVKPGGKKT